MGLLPQLSSSTCAQFINNYRHVKTFTPKRGRAADDLRLFEISFSNLRSYIHSECVTSSSSCLYAAYVLGKFFYRKSILFATSIFSHIHNIYVPTSGRSGILFGFWSRSNCEPLRIENHLDNLPEGGGGSGDGVFRLHVAWPLLILQLTSEEHLKRE